MITNLLLGSILLIGDSHSVGPFGNALNQKVRTLSNEVVSYAYCGSIANDWYKANGVTKCGFLEVDKDGKNNSGKEGLVPKFKDLLEKHQPKYVLVELATNYFGYESDEFVVNDMRRMARDIVDSGAECFWVGMPTSRKLVLSHERLARLTKEAVDSSCTYFNSFEVTTYPSVGGDGIHFYFPNGNVVAGGWAEAVFRSFKSTYTPAQI